MSQLYQDMFNVKPAYKVFRFTLKELESLFERIIELETGYEVEVEIDSYEKSTDKLFVQFSSDERDRFDSLSGPEQDKFTDTMLDQMGLDWENTEDNWKSLKNKLFGERSSGRIKHESGTVYIYVPLEEEIDFL